tara:strand:- start:10386 stop:12374 length:1989 start_codon:yes stop_codon:yes gene_type:complete
MTNSNYSNNINYKNPVSIPEIPLDDECVKNKKKERTNGGKCSIKIAINNKLYDEKNDKFDNSIIRKENVNKINLYKENDNNEYEYSLCDETGKPNCALQNKNIWLTTNNEKKCEINKNITLGPWNNAIENQEDGIKKLKKPDNHDIIINLRDKNSICDERWYDWFIIPDYHNGNNYSAEFTDISTERMCYKPCNFGTIPINEKDNENNTKCINRDLIDNGRLKNTFLYTPYSMIILLGSTKKDLVDLYKSEFNIVDSLIDKYNKRLDKDYEYEINNEILNEIKNIDTSNIIFDNMKNDLKKAIYNIVTEPISHLNIIPPIDNINNINYNPISVYTNKDILIKAYNISKKLSEYLIYDNLKDKFYDWKKELAIVNDLDINSWKFNKLLLILQACCKCCFGYQNKKDIKYKYFELYNNYIINKISKYNDDNITYNRIQFPNYTKEQLLKSIDTKNSFNNFNKAELDEIILNKIKDFQLSVNSNNVQEDSNYKSFNTCDIEFKNHKGDLIKNKEDCNTNKSKNMIDINIIDNTFSSNIIVYINFLLLALLMIIYLFMCYNLIIITWKQFANVINYILMGIIWIISTFIGIFTTLFGKADNKKGVIINIHTNALKGEWYYGYFMQTLAMSNAKSNYLFNGVLVLGMGFIFLIIVKTLKESFNIFKI